jgi:protein tyrosine/serine phosphatase
MKLRKKRILIAGLLIAAVLGGKYLYWAQVDKRFTTITEGKLYQSAEMPLGKLREKIEKEGIRTVIDLRSPRKEVDRERTYLTELGVNYINLPSGQHPKDQVIDGFLEIMVKKENLPVLVHCKHGMGRSVLLAALYRIEFEGWSKEEARRKAFWQSGLGFEFLQSGDKGRLIKEYSPRLKYR